MLKTKKFYSLIFLSLLILFFVSGPNIKAQAVPAVPKEESGAAETGKGRQADIEKLARYFTPYGKTAFVLSDGKDSLVYNNPLAVSRQSPWSTFKIMNSLIALEEKVITSDDSFRKWDGRIHSRQEINGDQDLASAFRFSCVWYYQELAREIGYEAMKSHMDSVGYGNGNIEGGLDTFWLGSTLEISPVEQVDFLTRLYRGELPFQSRHMAYVRSVMKQEHATLDLYGKTGSSGEGQGWFVGYVLSEDRPFFFAVYMEGENISGLFVRERMYELLEENQSGLDSFFAKK